MSKFAVRAVALALVLAISLPLTGCGGGQSQPTATPAKGAAAPTATAAGSAAAPTKAPAPAAATATKAPASGSATSTDLSSRVTNSADFLLDDAKSVLKSYHIEASGFDPKYNQDSKKIETTSYTLKADKAAKDLYLVYSSTPPGAAKPTVTEGYEINGGMSGGDNGKEYVVEGGKLKESIGAVSMTWVFFPLQVVMPLAFAATGPTAQGTEAIDGRQADKIGLDTANAPAGVIGALSAMFSITSAKGTVWVDKETGALLKCSLDYEQGMTDQPGSKTVVGTGKGHVELVVTKVNNTTVKLPQ